MEPLSDPWLGPLSCRKHFPEVKRKRGSKHFFSRSPQKTRLIVPHFANPALKKKRPSERTQLAQDMKTQQPQLICLHISCKESTNHNRARRAGCDHTFKVVRLLTDWKINQNMWSSWMMNILTLLFLKCVSKTVVLQHCKVSTHWKKRAKTHRLKLKNVKFSKTST